MRQINQIIIHCAATPPSLDIGAEEIRQWHLDRGWDDIGYHYVIRRSGVVEEGRPAEIMGAHARDYNDESLGICLVGGINDDGAAESNYTREQWKALERLVKHLDNDYPDIQVDGHRDIPDVGKDCPSFNVHAWWYGGREAE